MKRKIVRITEHGVYPDKAHVVHYQLPNRERVLRKIVFDAKDELDAMRIFDKLYNPPEEQADADT